MIKCKICEHYTKEKNRHKCTKCGTRIVYGALQETIIESCILFEKKQKADEK